MNIHVVEVRYRHNDLVRGPLHEADSYRANDVFATPGGTVTYSSPELNDVAYGQDPVGTLGTIGGQIADEIADGLRQNRNVILAGGNCSSLPAVIGGLQQGLGSTTRIGLVWFDAHGDFNTPKTTLSGMLGGMPVAVSAGLCYGNWRVDSRQLVPLPTDRIVMVDVRNLDEDEARLITATDVQIAPVSSVQQAVTELAERVDVIYLHIDLDILDERYVPTHRTKEPGGPDVDATLAAMKDVIDTGKVEAIGMVSVYPNGDGGEIAIEAASKLLRESVSHWNQRRRNNRGGDGT
jgi:arginase